MTDVTQYMNGFTSDHTPQSIKAQFINPQTKQCELSIRGATWNMMSKCFSKASCNNPINGQPYTNNPFNADETFAEYETRLAKQRGELQHLMTQGNNFILLQEANWVRTDAQNPAAQAKQVARKQQFDTFLARNRWAMITSPSGVDANGKSHQPLAILYNTNKLTPIGNPHGFFPTATNRYRGLEHAFREARSNKVLSIANLHLDFNTDYTQAIRRLQLSKTSRDIPMIMGGDTNHPMNDHMEGMIGNWSHATNIEGSTNPAGNLVLTDEHRNVNGNSIKKRYDGFFVNPTSTTQAKITECDAKYFKRRADNTFEAASFRPAQMLNGHATHYSATGMPWMRFVYLLKFWDKKLGEHARAHNTQAERTLAQRMVDTSQQMTGKPIAQHIDRRQLFNYQQLQVLEKHFANCAEVPLVLHPAAFRPNAFPNGAAAFDFTAAQPRALVFFEFSNTQAAQQFTQHLRPLIGNKMKELQGPQQNVVSFCPRDAQALGMDMQKLCAKFTTATPARVQQAQVALR